MKEELLQIIRGTAAWLLAGLVKVDPKDLNRALWALGKNGDDPNG